MPLCNRRLGLREGEADWPAGGIGQELYLGRPAATLARELPSRNPPRPPQVWHEGVADSQPAPSGEPRVDRYYTLHCGNPETENRFWLMLGSGECAVHGITNGTTFEQQSQRGSEEGRRRGLPLDRRGVRSERRLNRPRPPGARQPAFCCLCQVDPRPCAGERRRQ